MPNENLNSVTVEIKIAGKLCDHRAMTLHQMICGHHRFKVEVNYRTGKLDVWNITPEEIMDALGERLSIVMKHNETGETNEFYGVITKINVMGEDGDQGTVMLSGGSPTLLLETDHTMASFVDYNLDSIVKETLDRTGANIDAKIEARNKKAIPYVCRYKESSFGFLQRLLTSCGEWFFYDGKQLVVGFKSDPDHEEETYMLYDVDFSTMDISTELGNFEIMQYDYDYQSDTIQQELSQYNTRAINTYLGIARDKSAPIYKNRTNLPCPMPITNQTIGILESSVAGAHSRKFSHNSIFEASTRSCKVQLGKVIVAMLPKSIKDGVRDLGRFRVIEIVHTIDNKNEYRNVFKGVTASTSHMPIGDVVQPTAYPEVATVVDNNDPDKLGRVKVAFTWQKLYDEQGDTSSWMRVQTPDAGSSDKVSTNRGFFFVPEIGDQVMVGYEYGDPNRPFVMGSLFHKVNAGGTADKNAIRSIVTRSGSKLVFADKEDDETYTICLQVNDQNSISINVEKEKGTINIQSSKDIFLSAPELIQLEAKQIVMKGEVIHAEASDKIELMAEKMIHVESAEDVELLAKNIASESGEELRQKAKTIAIKADSKMDVDGGSKLSIKAGSIKMNQ